VWRRWRWDRGLLTAAGAVAVAVGLVAVGALVPLGGGGSSGSVTVAIVQGNVPRLGLDFNAQRRAVLDNHVQGTVRLAARVAAGEVPAPDLVVWPENASDVDPMRDPQAAASIDEAAAAIGVPILVGALSYGPGAGEVRNVSLVWEPGSGGSVEQVYVKRHPVPFAEYVPLRRLARMVSKQVDRVRADFVAGSSPGVLRLGEVSVSGIICFEVAYDGLVRDTVTGGAQVLAVQTNNASFNAAEAGQQLAMVRLRAVEHGRDGLMASTVGISAFVDQNGRVSQPTEFNTAAVVVSELDLGTTRTLATRTGFWPEMVLVVLAGAVVVVAGWLRRRTVESVTEAR
jgi:apolipoprotein N-acyltransferase